MTVFPPAALILVAAFPVKESSYTPLFNLERHSVCVCVLTESKQPAGSKDGESEQGDDFTLLKSLADGQKSKEALEAAVRKEDQYVPDESDSTKSRRLADDYDSTKSRIDYSKYQGTNTQQSLYSFSRFSKKIADSSTVKQFIFHPSSEK